MVLATRPLRGSRFSAFYAPPPAEGPSLSDLDSAFQLQEYISLLIQRDPHDVETIVAMPDRISAKGQSQDGAGEKEGKSEIAVDEACWIYEQLRRLAQDLTHPLITTLQQECSRSTCPEMKAGEWLYLCVAHGNDGAMEQCCAIDYVIHTLDSATALLNSPRVFPSRIAIPPASVRHFSSLARRLGRIFAHAFFHHRAAFEAAEAENALYARFLALTARFDLVPPEFLIVPQRAGDSAPVRGSSASNAYAPSEAAEHPSASAEAPDLAPPAPITQTSHEQSGEATDGEPHRSAPAPPGIHESPRRPGRARTDTMVFSDAAAFNEELQRAGALGLDDDHENEKDEASGGAAAVTSGEHPPLDTVELLAREQEGAALGQEGGDRPYTLSFSASGTMKGALPPGVASTSTGRDGSSSNGSDVGSTDIRLGPAPSLPSAVDANAVSELHEAPYEEEAVEDAVEDAPADGEDGDESDERIAELIARKQLIDAAIARTGGEGRDLPHDADVEGQGAGDEERGAVDEEHEEHEAETARREEEARYWHYAEQRREDERESDEAAIGDTEAGHEQEDEHEDAPEQADDKEDVIVDEDTKVEHVETPLEEDADADNAESDSGHGRSEGSSGSESAGSLSPSGSSEFVIVTEPSASLDEEETAQTKSEGKKDDAVKGEHDREVDPDVTLEEDLTNVEMALGH